MIKLTEIRKQEGVSQKQLANDLGVSAGNLCDWEKGRTEPNIDMLIKIADYFDVSVDALLGREENGNSMGNVDRTKMRLLSYYNKMSDEGKIKLVDFLETK
ncbi:MAG: helix-turn-helix transcriptional regulator [Clostridia bacterium]|nr:helix-turn-helix transcriptional regulator [Clostridia bacterium]